MGDLVTPEGHVIPAHIAVFNHSTLAANTDLAFWVAAVAKQLQEHVAPLWDGAPPGVALYEKPETLPEALAGLLGVVDDDGDAESAGFHTDMAGRIYGLVDMGQSQTPSGTLSHESLEMYGNAKLVRTTPGPNNLFYYVELCDPCQRDYYQIEVTLLGETRQVTVADFVLPRWFGLPNRLASDMRTTYLDTRKLSPFEVAPGGYQVAEDLNGTTTFLSRGTFEVGRSLHTRTNRLRMKKR